MSLVTWKDLVIDAVDAAASAQFWAERLGLRREVLGDGTAAVLRGDDPGQTIWINGVPEPKTVKNRVHLDVWEASLEPFGALERLGEPGEFSWTTFCDPEGNEFCVFVKDGAVPGFKALEIDAADHLVISTWWADVLGGRLVRDDGGAYSSVEDVPGLPGEGLDFAPVPEPKAVKNRVHWDVRLNPGASVRDLRDRGAMLLRAAGDDEPWTVMADPEGNEFCVFDAE
ncbi:VOC family protein [Aeromicrobium sp.]|uniref:VOC family protein n=1 Tax=Aeromicrobium sp. TaxID=1871063 RepID=UPI0025C57F2C|nr:VOC family protein [Aeromicrobium sp.]MCK5891941.1 VOC family protein [Aeromicrobium sp.]